MIKTYLHQTPLHEGGNSDSVTAPVLRVVAPKTALMSLIEDFNLSPTVTEVFLNSLTVEFGAVLPHQFNRHEYAGNNPNEMQLLFESAALYLQIARPELKVADSPDYAQLVINLQRGNHLKRLLLSSEMMFLMEFFENKSNSFKVLLALILLRWPSKKDQVAFAKMVTLNEETLFELLSEVDHLHSCGYEDSVKDLLSDYLKKSR